MGLAELLLTSVGLAADAFAVSLCKGLGMGRLNARAAAVIAAFFGGFQALMPIVGWAAGSQFASVVEPVGHWVAFGLLAFVGGKMIWDTLHGDEEDGDVPSGQRDGNPSAPSLDMRELFMLAIATSIDALAVGVSLALLHVDIVGAAACIGVVTFALSFAGVALGCQFGSRWERPSTLAGGLVLIAIGAKTLVEHFLA